MFGQGSGRGNKRHQQTLSASSTRAAVDPKKDVEVTVPGTADGANEEAVTTTTVTVTAPAATAVGFSVSPLPLAPSTLLIPSDPSARKDSLAAPSAASATLTSTYSSTPTANGHFHGLPPSPSNAQQNPVTPKAGKIYAWVENKVRIPIPPAQARDDDPIVDGSLLGVGSPRLSPLSPDILRKIVNQEKTGRVEEEKTEKTEEKSSEEGTREESQTKSYFCCWSRNR